MEMKQVTLHFHGELKGFLSLEHVNGPFKQTFNDHPSVKHLFESLGVPHTEVGQVLVDDRPVDFAYGLQDGDWVDLFPQLDKSLPSTANQENGAQPEPRFVLDVHLGKLAAYLRMLGFDAKYRNDYPDQELAQIAGEEERILLTRDRRLLMRSQVQRGHCLRSMVPQDQILEVVQRYHLKPYIKPFQRCLHCNGILQEVDKRSIEPRLEPLTRLYYTEFRICPDCQNIYWKGSHFQRMQKLVKRIMASS